MIFFEQSDGYVSFLKIIMQNVWDPIFFHKKQQESLPFFRMLSLNPGSQLGIILLEYSRA